MSATAFLREHGWKGRRGGWEHPSLPDTIHDVQSALLQQAQWSAAEADRLRALADAAVVVAEHFGRPRDAEREIAFMRLVNAHLRAQP